MPVFKKGAVSILYIHIPKTGGTTIEEALVDNGFEMSYRRGGRYGDLNELDKKMAVHHNICTLSCCLIILKDQILIGYFARFATPWIA